MITAGIKDLKNKLSQYLSFVKKGEDIVITERGKVIARIIQEDNQRTSLRQAFQPLIMNGLVTFPSAQLNKVISDPVEVPGKPISEMVIEDRR
ncbi:MAG: type II toxin-antitoxin system prevent-host-death family antitoxin [Pseudomonadota bacterium]|nr:type II toxin-antitoxin system prevent-host-death family antitoxin [Desulfobacterales bacterium]MBU0698592.1 type II toxin-antitoxin system prevent-host-death family antitoxin [Pseudomonadota bacterium]